MSLFRRLFNYKNDKLLLSDVYYADLFIINEKGCVIMGFGKSKTCRYFTGEDTKEIGVDIIKIVRDNKNLFGIYDPSFGMIPIQNGEKVTIDYFIRMLDLNETKRLNINKPQAITMRQYIRLCNFNICIDYNDDNKRLEVFKKIITKTNAKYFIVPWCDTMEQKGEMIKKSIV